jgi:hypothetical protein
MACRVVNCYCCFGRACCLHVQGSPREKHFKCPISAGLITNYTYIQETVLVEKSRSFMAHTTREWQWDNSILSIHLLKSLASSVFQHLFWWCFYFCINHLDPGGFIHVPPALILKHSAFCPHSLFLCSVQFTEQTVIISLYRINKVVFICGMECV